MSLVAILAKRMRAAMPGPQYCHGQTWFGQSRRIVQGLPKISYSDASHPNKKVSLASEMPATYDPPTVENGWYEWWQAQGYMAPQLNSQNATDTPNCFSMLFPPPNVTGKLHVGHALTSAIQDSLLRFHRMRAAFISPTMSLEEKQQKLLYDYALHIPGQDHAGIATQVVVEKHLQRQQKALYGSSFSRHDLGREKFLEEVWKWKNQYGDAIHQQLQRLGVSMDYSRCYFTLDDPRSKAVVEAFVRLHEKGLIYRQCRMVNWSCILQSAISDIEVDKIQIAKRTFFDLPPLGTSPTSSTTSSTAPTSTSTSTSTPTPSSTKAAQSSTRKVEVGVIHTVRYPLLWQEVSSHNALDASSLSLRKLPSFLEVATTRPETIFGDVALAIHPEDERYL